MTNTTVFYLQMTDPSQHRVCESDHAPEVVESLVNQGKVNRFLYDLVGEPWQWFDRKAWSLDQWQQYTDADDLRTFIAWVDGSIAGYFELRKQGTDTEIAYFGLAPAFTGRGIGGPFLSQAIHRAWAWPDTQRVILNTCTLDHPSALGNYQKRGFSIYRQKQVES